MNILTLRVFFVLFMVLVLSIIPLPDILTEFRPAWLLLFVLYLQFFLPNYFNIPLLFVLGFSLDVLLSTVIGEHVFALLFITWLASRKERRFRFFSIAEQLFFITIFSILYELIIFMIHAFLGTNTNGLQFMVTALVTIFGWFGARMCMDKIFTL